ncbi:hypothetical protein [Larkinella humicola]|uniref:Uncharacterized protein n=1 Tax=Larkinella humicola TaxID=2607654 RepID=A0A5N1JP53_9BACT|nr:hypothetical protein [Larkinella humicola]KAA9357247.1 hypothetical protein F0P93_05785 [Larkinella humicola]
MKYVLILCLAVTLPGCLTQKKILRKAETLVDTTYVTQVETVMIPRDSAVVRLTTDTTHVKVIERQGRATVTVIRTPTETTARADCDSIVKEVRVQIPCPPQLIVGVNENWRTAAFVLGALLLLSWVSLVMFVAGSRFAHRTQTKL